MRFRDRRHAGAMLAARLSRYAGRHDVVVLALPRGGVPVADEVARRLQVPLDVFVVRKLGVPGHEELAMGALASGGVRALNADVIEMLGIDLGTIEIAAAREAREIARRERAYRGDRPQLALEGRIAIAIDDGLATGATMRAAVRAIREARAARIVVAVPVGAPETCRVIAEEADEVVCVETPARFFAVGAWYEDFDQISDAEVTEILARAAEARVGAGEHPEAP